MGSFPGDGVKGLFSDKRLANDGTVGGHDFHLYVREKNPKAELWEGARSGTRAATDVFNADEVGRTCSLDCYPLLMPATDRRYRQCGGLSSFYTV